MSFIISRGETFTDSEGTELTIKSTTVQGYPDPHKVTGAFVVITTTDKKVLPLKYFSIEAIENFKDN
jgi:hypothetical protein